MPTFRQLEIFVEAAQDCNFRKTVDRLGISQPAISNHLQRLEGELGYPLFIRRRGSTPKLTPAGTAMLYEARSTLKSAKAFLLGMDAPAKQPVIHFKACIRHFMLERTVLSRLPAFLDRYPEIGLEFDVEDSTEKILSKLQSGACQMAIFRGRLPELPEIFRVESLAKTPCFIFASPQLRDEMRRKNLAPHEIPFVLFSSDSEILPSLLDPLKSSGFEPRTIIARSQFPEIITDWVLKGRGASPLLLSQMRAHVETGKVVTIGPSLGEFHTMIVSRADIAGEEANAVFDFFRSIVD